MKYALLSLLTIFFVDCKKNSVPITTSDTNTSSLTYLALGDSYTIGESVAENQRWPVQLAARLSSENFSFKAPQIIAKTGWTTDELNKGIDQAEPKGPYDLVSLSIGVNNQFRGRSAQEFESEFQALVNRAIGFAGNNKDRVLVLSIPDYGVTPFGANRNPVKIAKEIDDFNAIKKKICEQEGIAYFDITALSRKAANDNSLIASDGLHPSGKMYREWVDLIVADVKAKLK